ncbi:BID domain-containing T4SS effector [Bartonella ancashensis]|nr:BID domain-containing T4SS effector [Bartonella ancashensis]
MVRQKGEIYSEMEKHILKNTSDQNIVDFYYYPGTRILKNKYGIRNPEEFQERYSQDLAKAIEALQSDPLPKNLDFSYLKYIHQSMFKNTFEWAGCTREAPYTFSDGITAHSAEISEKNIPFNVAPSDEIQKRIEDLNKEFAKLNHSQDLSYNDFITFSAKIFCSISYAHPFKKGNESVQKVFFEKIFQSAGYSIDFSILTKARVDFANKQAIECGNVQPLHHMFEDISSPDNKLLLSECINYLKTVEGVNTDKYRIIVRQKGLIYEGIYIGAGCEGGFIQTKEDDIVIFKKEEISPELLRSLTKGNSLSFTAPVTNDVLIPGENLSPLSQSEISQKVLTYEYIQKSLEQIKDSSKRVYGNPDALDSTIDMIKKNPSLGKEISQKIKNSPESFAKIAGQEIFSFQNKTRRNAESHIPYLAYRIKECSNLFQYATAGIVKEHREEQNRRRGSVSMPDKDLQNLYSLPKTGQIEFLRQYPEVREKLHNYVQAFHARLSPSERQAIKDADYQKLAENIGTSVQQSKKIAAIFESTQKAYKQDQILKLTTRKPAHEIKQTSSCVIS